MKLSQLKNVRILVSGLVLLMMVLLFLDVSNPVVQSVSSFLLKLQLIPSLLRFTTLFLSVATLGMVLVLVVTLIWGRVYCSSVCPLGTLQDVCIALARKLKPRKSQRFVYTPNSKRKLRYGILAFTLLFWVFGSMFLINLLDPYSNFGKIAVTLFQPLYIGFTNFLSFNLQRLDIFTISPMAVKTLPWDVVAVSAGIFAVVAGLSVWRGRLFCNSLCPVGAFLGLISERTLYCIAFSEHACTGCGKCERVCKAECLDSRKKTVDQSRCVSCFNCFTACSQNGLSYQRRAAVKAKASSEIHKPDMGKRNFMLGLLAGILSMPLLHKSVKSQGLSKPGLVPTGTRHPITPPGSLTLENFTGKCVACYLCVSVCPNNVIVPSFFDYGLEGFMQPKLDYHKNFCNFDCVRCSEVCPTGAIRPQSLAEKQQIQVGIARFFQESCIVTIDRTDCGACSEHCPTKAVQMVPYEGLWLPEVTPDICVGCGACEYACPTTPYKAIYVESNPVHLQAQPLSDDQGPREHHNDGFPF